MYKRSMALVDSWALVLSFRLVFDIRKFRCQRYKFRQELLCIQEFIIGRLVLQ